MSKKMPNTVTIRRPLDNNVCRFRNEAVYGAGKKLMNEEVGDTDCDAGMGPDGDEDDKTCATCGDSD